MNTIWKINKFELWKSYRFVIRFYFNENEKSPLIDVFLLNAPKTIIKDLKDYEKLKDYIFIFLFKKDKKIVKDNLIDLDELTKSIHEEILKI